MTNTVETFDGTIASKKDCRFIKGDFYIKNKQCFLINGTWYRVNSGFITFDYEKQEWVITKDNSQLIKGIIDFDSEKNEIVLGFFTPNGFKNVVVYLPNGTSYTCIDYRILPNRLFKEDISLMVFKHNDASIPGSSMLKGGIPNISFNNNGYNFKLPYCCKHYESELYSKFLESAEPLPSPITTVGRYYDEIGNFSFGFEFETYKGKIPNYRILQSGLLPLRDGSINGIEFATIPLSGRKGFLTLENICTKLKTYTDFSINESLHLHIGNVPNSKKFVGYLYTLACVLENEIYSMFPKYYAQTSKFKARQKDYNMPLRKEFVSGNPEETFDNLAFYLSDGKKYQGFGSNHPSDPEGEHKWQVNSRYHWINFIPLMFGSNKTIEFRCHVPTRDPIKVLNWLYICSAIIKYADTACKKNIPLSQLKGVVLKDVITEHYSTRSVISKDSIKLVQLMQMEKLFVTLGVT